MRVHGGAFRFADDTADQSANGRTREEIVFTGYGIETQPQLVFRRASEERVTAELIDVGGDDDGTLALNLSEQGSDYQLYSRILPGEGAGPSPQIDQIAAAMTRGYGTGTAGIPAAYTYFGQFIAHDVSKLEWDPGLPGWTNGGTHKIELRSLFGYPGCDDPSTPHCVHDTVGLGQTNPVGNRNQDLPRRESGAPCVADPRSDAGPGVSQMHVALARFHHAVVAQFRDLSFEDRRRITRQHVQWIVLHDYLSRIVPQDVWNDVMHGGRKIVAPNLVPGGTFHIPMEFAVACFRFGHSMVRDKYKHWRLDRRSLGDLMLYAYDEDGTSKLSCGNQQLLGWTPDWAEMVDGATTVQEGAGIDLALASTLGVLDSQHFLAQPGQILPPTLNLAEATLLRGFEVNLPTAQALAAHIASELNVPFSTLMLAPHDIVATSPQDLKTLLTGAGFDAATPLWLYTLREAEEAAAQGGTGLGPVAGRVVMETLHAAIEASEDSIIQRDGDGKLHYTFGAEMAGNGTFTLGKLIEISNGAPDLCASEEYN